VVALVAVVPVDLILVNLETAMEVDLDAEHVISSIAANALSSAHRGSHPVRAEV
jgi:hypothetical protein